MLSPKTVTKQLRQVGCDYAIWGRTEIHELANILMDNERIMQAVNGYYDGGFALLVATNYRVVVVDKKPFNLTVEDLRYDMIAEVDYSSRLITAVLTIYTPLRTLMFSSWSMMRLRKSMNYIQQRVMELRNNDYMASQFATTNAQQAAPQSSPGYKQRTIQKKLPFLQNQKFTAEPVESTTKDELEQPDQAPEPQPVSTSLQHPYQDAKRLINPYTKVPLLARRRRYPSFY